MRKGDVLTVPIIFEERLGNSESDKKLRKIYHIHNNLWTIYYTIFGAGLGFGIAISVGANGDPIAAILIAIVTVGMLVWFVRRQTRRRRRR
ncbi:MAG: hypothetical protein H0V70_03800 [Ktedonobacteraceae bacterium]|nr:hypothetical protein [Ktedonobacteraceae bacterium]